MKAPLINLVAFNGAGADRAALDSLYAELCQLRVKGRVYRRDESQWMVDVWQEQIRPSIFEEKKEPIVGIRVPSKWDLIGDGGLFEEPTWYRFLGDGTANIRRMQQWYLLDTWALAIQKIVDECAEKFRLAAEYYRVRAAAAHEFTVEFPVQAYPHDYCLDLGKRLVGLGVKSKSVGVSPEIAGSLPLVSVDRYVHLSLPRPYTWVTIASLRRMTDVGGGKGNQFIFYGDGIAVKVNKRGDERPIGDHKKGIERLRAALVLFWETAARDFEERARAYAAARIVTG